jgi:hypothetical protein
LDMDLEQRAGERSAGPCIGPQSAGQQIPP